jgi:hypothetical protein
VSSVSTKDLKRTLNNMYFRCLPPQETISTLNSEFQGRHLDIMSENLTLKYWNKTRGPDSRQTGTVASGGLPEVIKHSLWNDQLHGTDKLRALYISISSHHLHVRQCVMTFPGQAVRWRRDRSGSRPARSFLSKSTWQCSKWKALLLFALRC